MFEFKPEFKYGDRLYEEHESSDFELTTMNVDAVELEIALVNEIVEIAKIMIIFKAWLLLLVIVGDVVLV